jgi:hypothetical protein
MRLINCSSLQLEEFFGRYIPDYVILSHTWEKEEISFADFTRDQAAAKTKLGFRKIDLTCHQALKDGWQYAWVDTCCIDKSSSAELSEAIKSMFSWYEFSKICYVYLSDVRQAEGTTEFSSSRWFKRGWTLQELLAPERVEFFDQDWEKLGTKKEHAKLISEIAGIDESILARSKRMSPYSTGGYDVDIGSFCVAKRMSWASRRETTRVEDTAYALLGIFNINMPLLYGEGKRAFIRLQEEVMRKHGDNSILAWGLNTDTRHPAGSIPDAVTDRSWVPVENFLASSPRDFRHCRNLVHASETSSGLTMTSVGLHLEMPIVQVKNPYASTPSTFLVGVLSCSTTPDDVVGIVLNMVSSEDDALFKVERQKMNIFYNEQPVHAIVLGPRAIGPSKMASVVILQAARPVINKFAHWQYHICLNESDALRQTGYLCTRGTVLGAYGDDKRTGHEWWRWEATSKMLSIDSVFDCQLLLGFRFENSQPSLETDTVFTMYMHTEHRKVLLFRNDLQKTADYEVFCRKMENNSLDDNTQSLTLHDADSRPAKLRVTIEEKEIFRWRTLHVNVDVEFETPKKKRRKIDLMSFLRHADVPTKTPSVTHRRP